MVASVMGVSAVVNQAALFGLCQQQSVSKKRVMLLSDPAIHSVHLDLKLPSRLFLVGPASSSTLPKTLRAKSLHLKDLGNLEGPGVDA